MERSDQHNQHKTVVIGAGIVGLSTAIWLARLGEKVRLIDRDDVGNSNAASIGNAGVLAACSVVSVTTPGLVSKGLKLLLDPNFPLFLRWSYLFRLMPWLFHYLSHANDRDTRRIAAGLVPLVYDSTEQYMALVKGSVGEDWLQQSSYGFVYPSLQAFKDDSYTWSLRAEAGFEPEILEDADVHDFEPSLATNLNCIAIMKNHSFLHNPKHYLLALKKIAEAEGVIFSKGEVIDFELRDNRLCTTDWRH